MRRHAWGIVGVLAAAAVVTVIVLSGSSGRSGSGTSAPEAASPQTEGERPQNGRGDQRAAYAVLEKRPVRAAALPKNIPSLMATVGRQVEADPSLAREAPSVDGERTFVIPGRRGLCLAVGRYAVCVPTSEAAGGYLVFWWCLGERPGHSRVAGVVPDSIRAVTVERTKGLADVAVRDNMYVSDAPGVPVTVTVGTNMIPMPSAGPDECG